MIKKIFFLLFSNYLMALLFIVFATAMGIGTFIESKYNTDTAKIMVYSARWFELVLLLFAVNFTGNIFKYKLYQKKKRVVLVIHLSFLFILLGAFVTRYFGFEGTLSLREGEQKNKILSVKPYLKVEVQTKGSAQKTVITKPLLLSQVTGEANDFSTRFQHEGKPISINYKNFVMHASLVVQKSNSGVKYLRIVDAATGNRTDHYIKEGELLKTAGGVYAYNYPFFNAVNFESEGDRLFVKSPVEGRFLKMATQENGSLQANKSAPLNLKSLYAIGNLRFVVPEPPVTGFLKLQSDFNYAKSEKEDALQITLATDLKHETITLFGKTGREGESKVVLIDDMRFTLSYGSIPYSLPFEVGLIDFKADKYPGTLTTYSSFESNVFIKDKKGRFDSKIYMNHVLDHEGYRFFQASYHPDEKGTILAVNHDLWGTTITYIGYFMLYFSLLLLLFDKNSRFGFIKKKLKSSKAYTMSLLFVFIFFSSNNGYGQELKLPEREIIAKKLDSIVGFTAVEPEHAARFGELVVQDEAGRMKPINTLSSELLRKISKRENYNQLNSDQFLLSVLQYPKVWYNIPIIYLKADNDTLRTLIGIGRGEKYASLADFFTAEGQYKIMRQVKESYQSAQPNQFEKDFIEADKRVSIFYNLITGYGLKLFPVPNNGNNKWIAMSEAEKYGLTKRDSLFVKNILLLYLNSLEDSGVNEDYIKSDSLLLSIERYQIKFGHRVRPSSSHIKAEILYNKYDIFKHLFEWYLYFGVLLLLFTMITIFKPSRLSLRVSRIAHYLITGLFVLHTLGLAVRWYISGHAPWSDAYESIIYISWATMLFGLVIGRKSGLTIASSAFVTSMILMVAHWNWLDPAIANLQPVLNSYWLMIHVAVIVASYGPFTLGMILGLLCLFLICFLNEKNKNVLGNTISRILLMAEMSLTVGLVMLTIGNFLGGQWANESWGRYWGWDPKETWALISIMVYSFVIHMRLVPILKSKWFFAFFSVLSYYAILMTYFGVNFYLTGLHSYAKGEKVILPEYLYYSIVFLVTLGIISFYKYRKYRF